MRNYKVAIAIGTTNLKSPIINTYNLSFIKSNSVPKPNNETNLIIDKVYRIVKSYKDKYDITNLDLGISSAIVIDNVAKSVIDSGQTIPI